MKKLFFFLLVSFSCISFGASNCSIYGNLAYEKMGGGCGCLFGFIPQDSNICVMGTSYCSQKFGVNAKYSSGSEQCSCQTGHEFASDSFGKTQCLSCTQIYGPNSEYFYLTQNCGCKEGYTLKEGKCDLKSNSSYFMLTEYDTTENRAVVESKYDGDKYLIELEYSVGSMSEVRNAINTQIVINMGTDFQVDAGDYVIIGDSKTVFKINSSKKVSHDFSFKNSGEQTPEQIIQSSISKELVGYWQSTASAIAEEGIIQKRDNLAGYNVQSFVLRQEIIAIAVKIKGLQLPDNYICKKFYRDVTSVKPNSWVCRTAEIGADNGLVSKQNKDFNPESNVTRVEALAILFNAFDIQYKNFDTSGYTFGSNISEWQKPVLAYAKYVDINSDISNTLANLPAVRGEIFTYIEKLLEIDRGGYSNPNFISDFFGH